MQGAAKPLRVQCLQWPLGFEPPTPSFVEQAALPPGPLLPSVWFESGWIVYLFYL